MARLNAGVAVLLLPLSLWGQTRVQQAGVCSRCHVVSVLEWNLSRHSKVEVNCQACHGPSKGHVANERDEVKPDRIPHGAAIAGLCRTCHVSGCPKTARTADCQTCHHVHALVNPQQPPTSPYSFRMLTRVLRVTSWPNSACNLMYFRCVRIFGRHAGQLDVSFGKTMFGKTIDILWSLH